MCYLLARFNNKFITGVKEDVGFLLSASGTSASAIDTLANAGLTVRKETIQKQKIQLANSHQQTVKDYIIDNVIFMYFCIIFNRNYSIIFTCIFFFLIFFYLIEKSFNCS
jgi:hypothetical protein